MFTQTSLSSECSDLFQLSGFCDKDHENTPASERHDARAMTEQNMFCDMKSAWEVMREHDDFKAG